MISISLFGKLTVTDSTGATIPLTGAKTLGLLAYLALNTEMPPTRDRLTALFWGDRFTDQARQSLRQAIAKLKRTLLHPDGVTIMVDGDRVGLNPELVSIDVDRFSQLVAQDTPQADLEAIALMKGPLLDGLFGQQAEFEDWIVSERQRYSILAQTVLERAAKNAQKQGQNAEAQEFARRMVAIDPLRDASQAVLIRILAQRGERAAAVQQFNTYQETLQKELGVGPGGELLKLMEEIRSEGFFAQEAEVKVPADLPSTSDDAATGRTSITVVPFATLESESPQPMFVEGLTEDVTTNLSRFSWLDVKASLEHDGPRLTSGEMSQLGKELGLDYVVHGSLRAIGNRIRLTAQLAEPTTARYVWVARYDRQADDMFKLLDDLSETIAASVEAELERRAGRSSREVAFEDMGAWDCYHRGLAIQYEFNGNTNLEAQKYFRRAIELDPNFGLAYARLSYALVISAIYFEAENLPDLLDEALELARVAARLEPDEAVARFALGRVYLARGEYDRSIADLKAAIALNPGMAQAHCGLGDSMAYSGQLDDAMDCFNEAVRISPADPYRWAFLGYGATALLFQGAYEKAVEWATEAETVPNSHYWPIAIRASALAHLGRMGEAKRAVADLQSARPGITSDFVRERLFYLRDADQIEIYVSGLQKAGLP
ncbi:BTAD domain-containing putative transcriptional regulator [Aliiroseovarius sp. KMU-50]|uniref:BTAD domain-containing putative transcriptional regulator n=1 Tax=Aliiroseovarius salicola TaxID=3009082 RepID=A0ABT4VX78_9RHOB|nr:BTAD domain-containing putative transcriptional regulator [Aliiroseovarius sp. KMU-50]MDA5092844.1 BTAD domain-containing putative transcriptional regulator [Aliiroseovarius sp. KMU-50]